MFSKTRLYPLHHLAATNMLANEKALFAESLMPLVVQEEKGRAGRGGG